jgi:hypothetical protein
MGILSWHVSQLTLKEATHPTRSLTLCLCVGSKIFTLFNDIISRVDVTGRWSWNVTQSVFGWSDRGLSSGWLFLDCFTMVYQLHRTDRTTANDELENMWKWSWPIICNCPRICLNGVKCRLTSRPRRYGEKPHRISDSITGNGSAVRTGSPTTKYEDRGVRDVHSDPIKTHTKPTT